MDIKLKDIKTPQSFAEVVQRSSLHLEGDYRKLGIWIRRVFVLDKSVLYIYRTKGDGGSLNGWCVKGAVVQAEYANVDGKWRRNVLNISLPNVYRLTLSLDSIYEQARLAEALQQGGARILCHKTAMLIKKLTNKHNSPAKRRPPLKTPQISTLMLNIRWTFENLGASKKDRCTRKSSSESDISRFYKIPKPAIDFAHEYNSEETLRTQSTQNAFLSTPSLSSDSLPNPEDREKSQKVLKIEESQCIYNLESVTSGSNHGKIITAEIAPPLNSVYQDFNQNRGSFEKCELISFNCDLPAKKVEICTDENPHHDEILMLSGGNSSIDAETSIHPAEKSPCSSQIKTKIDNAEEQKKNSFIFNRSIKKSDAFNENKVIGVRNVNRKLKPRNSNYYHKQLTRHQYLTQGQIEHRTNELMNDLKMASCLSENCIQHGKSNGECYQDNILRNDNTTIINNPAMAEPSKEFINLAGNITKLKEDFITADNAKNGANNKVVPNGKSIISVVYKQDLTRGTVKKLADKYEKLNMKFSGIQTVRTSQIRLPEVRKIDSTKDSCQATNIPPKHGLQTPNAFIPKEGFGHKSRKVPCANNNSIRYWGNYITKSSSSIYKPKEEKSVFKDQLSKSDPEIGNNQLVTKNNTRYTENYDFAKIRSKFEQSCN